MRNDKCLFVTNLEIYLNLLNTCCVEMADIGKFSQVKSNKFSIKRVTISFKIPFAALDSPLAKLQLENLEKAPFYSSDSDDPAPASFSNFADSTCLPFLLSPLSIRPLSNVERI